MAVVGDLGVCMRVVYKKAALYLSAVYRKEVPALLADSMKEVPVLLADSMKAALVLLADNMKAAPDLLEDSMKAVLYEVEHMLAVPHIPEGYRKAAVVVQKVDSMVSEFLERLV